MFLLINYIIHTIITTKNNHKLSQGINRIIEYSFICSLLFFSCSKSESDQINPHSNLTINEAKDWFNSNYQHSSNLQSQNELLKNSKADSLKQIFEWDKPLIESENNQDVIEVPTLFSNGSVGHMYKKTEELSTSDDKRLRNSLTRLVILKNKGGEKRAFLMTQIGDPSFLKNHNYNVNENTYFKKMKDFTGLVLFHTPEGDFINGWRFKDGKVDGSVNIDTGYTPNSLLKVTQACSTYQVTTYWEQCTDWYGGDGQFIYTGCNNYTTTSYYSICTSSDGGGGGGGGGVAPTPTPTPTPVPVIKSTDLDKNPIAKCVYGRLLSNSIFQRFLDPFKPQNSVSQLYYHLASDLPINISGQTRVNNTDSRADIYINANTLSQRSSDAIAGTFIHETVHAYIFCYLQTTGYSYLQLANEDTEGLFMLFMKNKLGGDFDKNNAQHIYMAENFVGYMANALKGFDSSLTDIECYALAWSGLQNTPLFTYKTAYDQNNINSIINNITTYGKKDCITDTSLIP